MDDRIGAIERELAQLGCSDGGCSVRRPRGMATQGGCHCLGDTQRDWSPELRMKLRRVLALRQEQTKLLAAEVTRLRAREHRLLGAVETRGELLAEIANKTAGYACLVKRCACQWEAGDSPCPTHGEEDGSD